MGARGYYDYDPNTQYDLNEQGDPSEYADGAYGGGYNDQYTSDYDQLAGQYDDEAGMYYVDPSEAPPGTPGAPNGGDPDYYVSLEPCPRGSSCSMYDPVDPKCLIRLVGKGYQKDIELSLDAKMDSLIYRMLRCLEEEGFRLDGVRLQGLPKKNCLKNCLAALCAPFTALCTGPLKPSCCQTLKRPCCCTFSSCPKRSLHTNPRRSSASARYSWASQRASVGSYRRRRRPRHSVSPKHRRPSLRQNPCRMAKICQGPQGDDCVLIKISPSLPKVGGLKCEKRSTGVGTDEFPELEILLEGGNKKRCAARNKTKVCPCARCCSGGKLKIVKCRSRWPKRKERRDLQDQPRGEEWPEQESEWNQGSNALEDNMSEEDWNGNLGESGREGERFSFGQPPPPSSVNFVLVENRAHPSKRSSPSESESHLVLPKKVDAGTNPSGPKCEIHKPVTSAAPLNVYSVHQPQNDDGGKPERSSSPVKQRKSDPETALLMRKVLHLVNEIFKKQNEVTADSQKESQGVQNEKPGENPRSPTKTELNPIFHRSDLWLSGSDVASDNGLNGHDQFAKPPRGFSSSKSINFVARIKKSCRRKKSPGKIDNRNQDAPKDKFKKLRIYLENDTNGRPAEYVPIELTKKDASVHLNTLMR